MRGMNVQEDQVKWSFLNFNPEQREALKPMKLPKLSSLLYTIEL